MGGLDVAERGAERFDTAGLDCNVYCNEADKKASSCEGDRNVASKAVWNDVPWVRTLLRCGRDKCSGFSLGVTRFGLLRDARMPVGVEVIARKRTLSKKAWERRILKRNGKRNR